MKPMDTIKTAFKRYFLIGLIVLLPFFVTFKFLVFVVGTLDSILKVENGRFLWIVPEQFHPSYVLGFNIPGIGVIFTVLLILGVGVFSRFYLGNKIIQWSDLAVNRIPFLGAIHKIVKQIIDTYTKSKETQFRRVVMIEYPRNGLYTLAFVTGGTKGELQSKTTEDLLNVFVPTTPNPTSGFFLMVPRSDALDLDLTIEEAFKLVVSGGMVSPEELRTKKIPNGGT